MQKHRTRAGGLETTFTAMKGTSCDHLRQAPRRDAPRASSFLPDPAAPPFPGRSPLSPAPSLHCISRVLKLRPSQHTLSEASPSQVPGPGVQGRRSSQLTHLISPPHVLRPRTSVSSFLRPPCIPSPPRPPPLGSASLSLRSSGSRPLKGPASCP